MARYTTAEMRNGRWLVYDEYQEPIITTDTEEDALRWIESATLDEQQQAALEDMRANGEGRDAALALSYWLGED